MNIIPDISVIVASKNGQETIEECLTSIEKQKENQLLEIIVVTDNSKNGTSQIIKNRFPGVKLIELSKPTLIPYLWSAGIEAASGEILAITIAQCIPTIDWVHKLIESLKPPYSAVGGAIENSETASLTDWALYFCRYSNYMPPFDEREVLDMAGHNRSAPFPIIKRFVFILASPLIPFIHLYRIAHRVMNRNRHVRKLILSLPILFIFLLCWSVGENCGYISGIFKKHES